jgi:3-oxoacyl-[acyl-carrier-protein] synthase II
LSVAGFGRLRALSTHFNDAPSEASRPFDGRRDGFVIGEGAAVLVLEEESAAVARGAPVLARFRSCGLSCDAHHMTAPEPHGRGALAAMRAALRNANRDAATPGHLSLGGGLLARLEPGDVDYVNAHATSTPLGDAVEGRALDRFFGPAGGEESGHGSSSYAGSHGSDSGSGSSGSSSSSHGSGFRYVSSTKGATGHLLGAAGALEAAFAVLSLHTGLLPTTYNLDYPAAVAAAAAAAATAATPGAACGATAVAAGEEEDVALAPVASARWQHVPPGGRSGTWAFAAHAPAGRPRVALCNSFGFGGANASLLFTVP